MAFNGVGDPFGTNCLRGRSILYVEHYANHLFYNRALERESSIRYLNKLQGKGLIFASIVGFRRIFSSRLLNTHHITTSFALQVEVLEVISDTGHR